MTTSSRVSPVREVVTEGLSREFIPSALSARRDLLSAFSDMDLIAPFINMERLDQPEQDAHHDQYRCDAELSANAVIAATAEDVKRKQRL
jgi:hypothetical protein